jgi:hypothetical protein
MYKLLLKIMGVHLYTRVLASPMLRSPNRLLVHRRLLPLSFDRKLKPLSSCHELAPSPSFPSSSWQPSSSLIAMATELQIGWCFELKSDEHPVEWNRGRPHQRQCAPITWIHGRRCQIGKIWSTMDHFSYVFYSMWYMLVNFVTNT